MDQLWAWASSQPVWVQVVIGLTVFFVGLPLAVSMLGAAVAGSALAVSALVRYVAISVLLFIPMAGGFLLWHYLELSTSELVVTGDWSPDYWLAYYLLVWGPLVGFTVGTLFALALGIWQWDNIKRLLLRMGWMRAQTKTRGSST